jgi:hypothetical protein
MIPILAAHWLAGSWYPDVPNYVRDVNGDILNVGDKVFIPCIVASINKTGFFTGNVTLTTVCPEFNTTGITISSLSVTK